jgi:hypothetical protein
VLVTIVSALAADSLILSQIAKIRHEKNIMPRTMMAQYLSQIVRDEGPQNVTAHEIQALTRLLEDKDDGIRMWAANCLYMIGPRARVAIPELKRAYRKIACTTYEVSSEPEIEFALRAMHSPLPRVHCRIKAQP